MWISYLLQLVVRLLIGAYPRWIGCKPSSKQRIYFANHTSHIDTVAIWAALPQDLQATTHPVGQVQVETLHCHARFERDFYQARERRPLG